MLVLVYLLALVFGVLTAILTIRFLWMVPNQLRDLSDTLKRMYLFGDYDDVDDDDIVLDPNIVKKVERQVQSDFENSSTLQ